MDQTVEVYEKVAPFFDGFSDIKISDKEIDLIVAMIIHIGDIIRVANILHDCYGNDFSQKFLSYYTICDKLPSPDEILSGKFQFFDTSEKYAIVTTLVYDLKKSFIDDTEDVFYEKVDNFVTFADGLGSREYLVMGLREIIMLKGFVVKKMKNQDIIKQLSKLTIS